MKITEILKVFAIFSLNLLITSCIDNISEHGINYSEDIESLRIGSTKQHIATSILGPASISTKRDDKQILIYIDYDRNKEALKRSKIVKYDVAELVFKDNILQEINNYDIKDIKKISYSSARTKDGEVKTSIWQQILRNVGRFDGESGI